MQTGSERVEVSVVMPCLNEERTVGTCIKKAFHSLQRLNLVGEVIISDSGSTDRSVEIAKSLGARVVYEPTKGYGNALRKGIKEAQGKYIIMGDADDSYDFSKIEGFIKPLKRGYDVVIGTRFEGKVTPGAMPWLHRYIGNPLLSWYLNRLFHTRVSDVHCGMRSFTKDAYQKMNLQSTGMEFASEMVIKASKANLKITEIPITLYPDGRKGKTHIRSFRDGWRHVRLMLMYSPTHLFLIPGIILMVIGLILSLALLQGPIYIGGRIYDFHFSLLGSLLTILGFQVINLGLYARAYAFKKQIEKDDKFMEKFYKYFSLERGLIVGFLVFLIGLLIDSYTLVKWIRSDFGPLFEISRISFATTLLIIGIQIIFSSFLLSMLDIKVK